MNGKTLLLLALALFGAVSLRASEPLSYQEISLMVRSGDAPQSILDEAARRKLLMALTPDQEGKLQQNGAPAALLAALRSPSLLASPAELQAYVAKRQRQAQVEVAASQAQTLASAAPVRPQAIVLPDHFADSLEAAKTAPARAMTEADAFSLAQVEEARAKARSERKPMGFIVVSQKCFGQAYNTRQSSGYAALLHFYEAFKEPLVLVFVPNGGQVAVPEPVGRGLKAAAGSAPPCMAVIDATASELICVITSGDTKTDGAKRDEIFKAGAAKIQEWLSYHPAAISTGPPTARQ